MPTKLPISNAQDWSLSLSSEGVLVEGLADIAQCIELIIKTEPGSDPLRPTFGTRYLDHIDKPVNVGAPAMVNEIIDAITLWEPRVKLESVNWAVDISQVIYEVRWDSKYGKGVNTIPL